MTTSTLYTQGHRQQQDRSSTILAYFRSSFYLTQQHDDINTERGTIRLIARASQTTDGYRSNSTINS